MKALLTLVLFLVCLIGCDNNKQIKEIEYVKISGYDKTVIDNAMQTMWIKGYLAGLQDAGVRLYKDDRYIPDSILIFSVIKDALWSGYVIKDTTK